jgi:5'-nucleotidase
LERIAGIQLTCLSQRRYRNPIVEKTDPRGNQYFWIAGERESWARGKPSDHDAVSNNMVSISPLHLDLTDYSALESLKGWEKALSFKKQPLRDPSIVSGRKKRSSI